MVASGLWMHVRASRFPMAIPTRRTTTARLSRARLGRPTSGRARLAEAPRDFEAAWKLARGGYWLGTNGLPAGERKTALERGIVADRQAATLEPKRPEGHFWMAANMGALAESFGLRRGIRYRGAIRDELETVLALDPAYQYGSADQAARPERRGARRAPGRVSRSRTRDRISSPGTPPGPSASAAAAARTAPRGTPRT